MGDELLIELFVVHLILTLLAYVVVRRQSNHQQAWTEAGIVLMVPVAGFVVIMASRILHSMSFLENHIDPHKLMNKNDVFTNMISYDENIIPLHDTFLVDDVKVKRKVFLDAVKQNVLENPKVLRMATHDADREIAYYAVSMISGDMEELEGKLAEVETRLQTAPEDVELIQEYADLLGEYVEQDYADAVTKREKRKQYVEQLNKLMAITDDKKDLWEKKIDQEILLEDFAAAEQDCSDYLQSFPMQETPYILYMKLYFAMREPEKLQQKLQELKDSPAELSVEALELVRYWGGYSHE